MARYGKRSNMEVKLGSRNKTLHDGDNGAGRGEYFSQSKTQTAIGIRTKGMSPNRSNPMIALNTPSAAAGLAVLSSFTIQLCQPCRGLSKVTYKCKRATCAGDNISHATVQCCFPDFRAFDSYNLFTGQWSQALSYQRIATSRCQTHVPKTRLCARRAHTVCITNFPSKRMGLFGRHGFAA